MAVNIYLVFFHHWNTHQLQGLDRKYFVVCYGVSLIPATVYLFIETNDRGKIYGGAIVSQICAPRSCMRADLPQLWCWVAREWDFLRIAVLYVFMWYVLINPSVALCN